MSTLEAQDTASLPLLVLATCALQSLALEPGSWRRHGPQMPLIFFAIDSMESRSDLRRAVRETWLRDVRRAGHEYRFFMFEEKDGSNASWPADVVLIPKRLRPPRRYPREFSLLRFAFKWSMAHSQADFIVKADHDMFVCPDSLEKALADTVRTPFFMGYYWYDPPLCRADQNFLIYNREALWLALDYFERTKSLPPTRNWALNWGMLAKHLWAHSKLTVVDDNVRIDSQQGYHFWTPINLPTNRRYCDTRLAMHLFSSVFPEMNASKVMHTLHGSSAKGVKRPLLDPQSGNMSKLHLQLGPPRCIQEVSAACMADWTHC